MSAAEPSALRIPPVDREWSNLELALALAAAGFYVLPTSASGDAKHAGSVLGKGWPGKSSRDADQIAAWFAGTDHRVAIHCGRSGLVAFDLDHPDEIPERLAKAVANETPPYQSTRPDEPGRGHYLFAQPPGRRLGNRAGALGKAWGEVRGTNGIILVGGEGREWLQTGDVPELPSYIAELLPDVADGEAAVGDAEVHRFVTEHTLELVPNAMQAVLTGFERAVEGGGSRHDAAVSHACWMVRDVIGGKYSARKGFHRLEELFVEAMAVAPTPGERTLPRGRAQAEFISAVAWAIGQTWTPPGAVEGDEPIEDRAEAARESWLEFEIEAAAERMAIQEQARERLSARRREPLRVLTADEFLDAPPPEYLVPNMLYRDGLAVVFGAPGAAKSFLVLDIALCLATGTPWRGRKLGRTKVHYVMAEGQATNTLRTRAWLTYHGVDRAELRDWWTAIPTAIPLTEAGIVDYLPLVEADQPGMIILDTKNLMFEGKESQGDDYGLMLRVLHRIREAAGGCAVVLIDHSGLADDTRTRGSNAQKGGVETEIRVVHEEGVRRAEVTRDKSGVSGTEWLYRLQQVPSVVRPAGVAPPAVCVPLEPNQVAGSPFAGLHPEWWQIDIEAPPAVVSLKGPGSDAAREIFRVLAFVEDNDGLTFAEIRRAINERPGGKQYSEPTARRGKALLENAGVIQEGGTAARRVLAPEFWEEIRPEVDLVRGSSRKINDEPNSSQNDEPDEPVTSP